MKRKKLYWFAGFAILEVLLSAEFLPGQIHAQQASSQQPKPATHAFSYEGGTSLFKAYSYPYVPPPSLTNSPQINQLIQNNKLELSLDNALELALQNNLDIAVARYELPLARLDILRTKSGGAARGVQGAVISNALFTGAIGVGISSFSGVSGVSAGGFTGGGVINTGFVGCCDPVAGVSFGWNNNKTPLNFTQLVGIPVEGSHTSQYATFFGQGLMTGTSYTVAVTGQRQSTTSLNALFNPAIPTGLTVGLDQHLLKGFGYRANGVFLRIARNDLHVADTVFRQQIINTVAQVLNAYYLLLADRDQVRVAQSAVDYSQKLVIDDQKQVQIGTLAPLDVVQAESELATDQQNLIVAQTTYLQQQEVLKTMIAKKVSPELASVAIHPTDTLPEPKPGDVPPLDEALKLALINRPEIRQDELNLRNQYYVIQSNRNGLLPSLDAFATYAASGLSGLQVVRGPSGSLIETIPGGFGDSLRDVFIGKYPNYSFGLTLSIPLRNRAEQANAAQALVEEHEMETGLQREKNQVAQDVRNAEIAVTQAKAQIDAAIKARVYAHQALIAEIKKLREGVSTTLDVILMQRNLVTAEGNEAKARQTYAQSLVQLGQATGTILDMHHIVLADPRTGRYERQPNIPGTPTTGN
ncbi:MAG: TolC family protein [Acidobacteria bacterium]|nr:TolC family protein [Acidobacteriota bacterium]